MKSAPQITPAAIDHLGVVGRDITKMTAAYARLGFQPTAPEPLMGVVEGQLVPLGQDSAHLIFKDSYIELTGVTSTDPAHHLAPWLGRHEGLHILAFSSSDAQASHAALTSQGLEVPAVQSAGRYVRSGQHHGDAKFKWFKAPDALGEEGFVCLVEQITPELVFQPPTQGHPNGAIGVAGVTVLAENVDAAMTRFASYPGATVKKANTVTFDHQTLTFLDDPGFRDTYPGIDPLSAPALAGFTVFVADLETTRVWLEDNDVTVRTTAQTIWVPPSQACGAVIAFKAV
ncbi:MAG: VOC family protein [Rhodospirillaceae bacterium]